MYQAGPTCYDTAAAANAALGSAQSGSVVPFSGSASILVFRTSTDNSITYDYHPADSSPIITQVIPITPPPCALLTASDAYIYGWTIGGVWIAVYAIIFLARTIYGFSGASNDT